MTTYKLTLRQKVQPPLDIYPALYPLESDRYAVAVLAGWSER